MGGQAVLNKYGRLHYSVMGLRGAKGKVKKYGSGYWKTLSKFGVEARKNKRLLNGDNPTKLTP